MKVYRFSYLLYACIYTVVAVLIFVFFDYKYIKYPIPIFLLILTIGAISEAFEKNPSPKTKFSNAIESLSEDEKYLQCQRCDKKENVINVNIRPESKLYISDKTLMDVVTEFGLDKYPILCFNCNYVSYCAEYHPPKKYSQYYDVVKLNEELKKDFLEFAEVNKHFDKVEKINSISV